MGMRIRTNVASLVSQRFMEKNNAHLSNSLERLSSGYRINKSADDAAGLAISENLRGQVRGLNVAKRNANDAISLIQVAEGGMNEMTNILIRLRELTTQSASDTLGEQERSFLNKEYTQMVDELDRIGNASEFNGKKIFDMNNELSKYVIQVGIRGTSPEENTDTLTINLEGLKFNTETLGFGKGSEIGADVVGEQGPTRDEIAARLTTVDTALARISSERATLGSVQSRLGSSISNLGLSIESQQTAMSRIKDVDFAAETANLTQSKIMTQSSSAVLLQANAAPELALQLLHG